ncbi:prion-inhibition and propagation-domain-containing protein [Collybia nuda]|uniref:Prion-inhibition and propagation-domain-containing protein n=1 Tax=Collybia nuda TaxID=64659 RepID=A0A9P5Y2U0_9AGAR|nr:prion-inhibition and propagation-domain-containing protein [Collybia nuda]
MADVAFASIAFVGQCYKCAIQAYLTLQRCIEFSNTSAKLILKLDLQRIRLQLWGRNSGADEGNLRPELSPYEPLINGILEKITRLIQDSDKLKDKYGLVNSEARADDSGGSVGIGGDTVGVHRRKAINQVKGVLNTIFTTSDKRRLDFTRDTPQASPFDRLRWAIVSQQRFESLLEEIRSFVDDLNKLLRESQLASLSQDWRLLEFQTVARIDDPRALDEIQQATDGDVSFRAMNSMAGRKIIATAKRGQPDKSESGSTVEVLSKVDFDLPDDFYTLSRCIAVYNPLKVTTTAERSMHVLIEKKGYDASISSQDKGTLLLRLLRLIKLLNSPCDGSQALLQSIGYWSEPQFNCWYLVYKFPLQPPSHIPLQMLMSTQPPSLLLFLNSTVFKPSLESRLVLAQAIVVTFSHLYGSQWLHKGVRSENIFFSYPLGGFYDISAPFIGGFEYSRQYTEEATVDRTPFNIFHAIYRHPSYQGLAAKGYRMSYDIYSLGLVLAEIAFWRSLGYFYAQSIGVDEETGKIQGRPFGAEEATNFRIAMLKRVRKELAFRVGTIYKNVVEWCLTCGEGVQKSEGELAVDFYKNVVAPLENKAAFF